MSLFTYDLTFLIIFSIFLGIFLYKRRKNLKREGLMFLYRTKIGINFIDKISKKHKRVIEILDWFSIITGYILMITALYLMTKMAYVLVRFPEIYQVLKVPPLMPLIPYLPSIFKIDFLPPFYFTYWIISLGIIAVVHEFSHGIFAKSNGIKIKSTGFGFLGPFIGAFVEPDDKKMVKAPIKKQLAILSAGTFSNLILSILFYLIFVGFFFAFFTPAGYIFNIYTFSLLPANETIIVGNYSNMTQLEYNNKTYFIDEKLSNLLENSNLTQLVAYDDTPAIRTGLSGAIIRIDGEKITDKTELENFLAKKSPGENITIITLDENDQEQIYQLTLAQHPLNSSKGYIGITYLESEPTGFISKISFWLTKFKDESTYYSPRINKDFSIFIYNLIWWIALLNFSVAIMNMLPAGLFDGGRFFYLTMLFIFKSERIAKKLFAIATYFIIFLFGIATLMWFFRF